MIQWKPRADHPDDQPLQRRGYDLGAICMTPEQPSTLTPKQIKRMWQQHKPVFLPALVADVLLSQKAPIAARESLIMAILEGHYPSDNFIADSKAHAFSLTGSSEEAHDAQAIEKIFFTDEGSESEHDNLWCKASWLSFYDDDASLRFRFSFGMEGFEDVTADPARQQSAANLCTALFPESAVIEKNQAINTLMASILGGSMCYVERIVYFNAPHGGAQMHHDVERGHAGVVYAQLTGKTFWLALSKPLLVAELCHYNHAHPHLAEQLFSDHCLQIKFNQLLADQNALDNYLDQDDHELLEVLMDQHPDFIRHMLESGHGFVLQAGDVLLLPQQDLAHCVWHTVFCLGDEMGEALSFAVRRDIP
ncbi:MAG: hypothetical protein Q9M22_01905 [Mariprofundaceae bacterium]|nr:hypothetical protein [Mariprofundaceae bacterium]